MGGHYGSVQLRTPDRPRVLAAAEAVARAAGIKCLVGPALNGWVGVYPEGNGQDHTVGERLAAAVGGNALHVLVHDDDVLAYWLWHDGQLVDRYWSAPGYFGEGARAEEEALIGDPERFAFVVGEADRSRLLKLLRRDSGPTVEHERLVPLGKLLGIRNLASAYEYLQAGDIEDVTGWPRRFKEVPADRVSFEREQRAAEAQRIDAGRRQMMDDGLLLFGDRRVDRPLIACAAADGFVVVWPDHGQGGGTAVEYHRPPWDGAVPADGLDLPPNAHVTAIATDARGHRLAMAAGNVVRTWDWTGIGWKQVADIAERDLTVGVAVSPDGARVAHLSRREAVVTDVSSGQVLARCRTAGDVKALAFSPAGDWLALAGRTLTLMPAVDAGDRRDCPVRVPPRFGQSSSGLVDPAAAAKAIADQHAEVIATREEHERVSRQQRLMPKQLAEMATVYEQMLERARRRIKELEREIGTQEQCLCVNFDGGGCWMWVGTMAGLRVYDCAATLRGADALLPIPTFVAELPTLPPADGLVLFGRPVHTAVAEPGGRAILFGGSGSGLHRLDLQTGSVRQLVTVPGGGHVLAITPDATGSAVGVASHVWSMETVRQRTGQRFEWDVLAYPQLRDGGA